MKFMKPTIIELGRASQAIQSVSLGKIDRNAPDQGGDSLPWSTGASYNLDE